MTWSSMHGVTCNSCGSEHQTRLPLRRQQGGRAHLPTTAGRSSRAAVLSCEAAGGRAPLSPTTATLQQELCLGPHPGGFVNYQPDYRVTPFPGITRAELIKTLNHVHTELGNVRGKTTQASEYPMFYLTWVSESVRMLRFQVSSTEIDRLLLTRRYWAIQSAQGFESAKLAETEIDDRAAALGHTIEWLIEADQKWKHTPGLLIVADSGFFCNHEKKLRDIRFADMLDIREVPVRLMLPMVVLDELDGLKQHNNDHVRWRAGHTLGVLDEVLNREGIGMLRDEDYTPLNTGGIPRGRVSVEVYFEPPGHRRLPINDDEIIDRALAIQAEAERDVTFWTFDTSQSTRAKFRGLAVQKFKKELGEEPARGGRAKRKTQAPAAAARKVE